MEWNRILWKMRLWKCEFCEKWDFENVNFVKIRFWKCEFWQKWDFENLNFGKKWDFESVNFGKNEILKMWISWKVRFSKCEFLDKLRIFCPSVLHCNIFFYLVWRFLVCFPRLWEWCTLIKLLLWFPIRLPTSDQVWLTLTADFISFFVHANFLAVKRSIYDF